jgi:hypothetical protein
LSEGAFSVGSPGSPSSPSFPGLGERDEADPELSSLPEPPRTERRATLLLLAITALASAAMVLLLGRDAAYAFASVEGDGGAAVQLGDLRTVSAARLASNTYTQGEAMLGGASAIRFRRSFESDSFRLAPVAGRPDVWVELRVPEGTDPERFVPPTRFAGRLVPFEAAGPRHRGLARSVHELTGQSVPPGAWLLVDGESPAQARWALVLVTLFAGFAVWNAVTIARLVKRVKPEE